jgi:hypothetical protein
VYDLASEQVGAHSFHRIDVVFNHLRRERESMLTNCITGLSRVQ